MIWTKVRHLNHLQKQRLTNRLFVTVAFGAVLTVAGPTLLPCPAYENTDERAAFLEEDSNTTVSGTGKNKKKKVVIVKKRKRTDTGQIVKQALMDKE